MRDWTRRRFLRQAAAAAVAVGGPSATAAGCAGSPAATTLDEARASGVITVGFANEAPYGFLDANGALTGQAPEVARVVLRSLGINTIEGVLADFRQLIPGLQARRYALVAAGMFITPQRCAHAAFSIPDYEVRSTLLVQAGNPAGITTLKDVRPADVRIAVLTGAAEFEYALDAGVPQHKIITIGDQDSLFRAVHTNRVYGAAMPDTTASYLLGIHPRSGLERTPPFVGSSDGPGVGAFTFPLGATEFVAEFNARLRDLHESGEWLRIVEPFGFGPEHVPSGRLSNERLCEG